MRQPMKCYLLKDMYFDHAVGNVYIEKNDVEAQQTIIKFISSARTRIQQKFGDMRAAPPILIAKSPNTVNVFYGNPYGVTHRSPFGSCIVIGDKGQNIDVIAHELMHAELAERLGHLSVITELPVWFDEGFATLADYRAPYLPENMDINDEDIKRVKQLFWGHEFYNDQRKIVQRYQAAKLAVMQNLKPEDYMGIFNKLEERQSFDKLIR